MRKMKRFPSRRQFVGAVASLFVVTLSPAQPRQAALRKIGVLYPVSDSLKLQLKQLGWVEGENVSFELEFGPASSGDKELQADARRLVRRKVDLIFVPGSEAARAAARATSTIPIVFQGGFPVEQGLVASYAHPGGNITGVANAPIRELLEKRLDLLKQLVPTAKRLFCPRESDISDPKISGAPGGNPPLEEIATKMGFQLRTRYFERPTIQKALSEMESWRAEAVVLHGISFGAATKIIQFALKRRIPTASGAPELVLDGALFSYHVDTEEFPRLIASYIDQILRGARPAEMPVLLPSAYKLYVNRKTANAIRLKLPDSFLMRADYLVD